jgi:MFS family permease
MIQSSGSILGGLTVSKLIKKNHTIWVKIIGMMISLCLWFIIHPIFGFYALFLLGFLDSLLYVTLMHIINDSIQSHQRATLLSVNSMFFSVVMIVVFPLFGYLAEITNLSLTFSFLAGFTTVIALILSFMNIKHI